MDKSEVEKLRETQIYKIIRKANTVGNPFVDENIAKAILDAGYLHVEPVQPSRHNDNSTPVD